MVRSTPPNDDAARPPPKHASSILIYTSPTRSRFNDITGKIISSLSASRPIDVHVGQHLRQRRTILGLSQKKLGAEMGLTRQHIRKYEHGTTHISASQLRQIAKILGVEISYFFGETLGFYKNHDQL